MKSIIPYEKEINFETKISEICSISLEYEADVKGESLEGNFFIEGEYKVHEISVNKEAFKFKLPFVVELGSDWDPTTVKHDITDFTYDIVGDSVLKVNIDLLVEGEEKEVEEPVDEEDRKGELIDDPDDIDDALAVNDTSTNLDDILENLDIPLDEAPKILDKEETAKLKEESQQDEVVDQNIILNNALDNEDTYVTYHIHIVKEEETLESISTLEHVSKELICDCNDFNTLTPGMKLIIPSSSDE